MNTFRPVFLQNWAFCLYFSLLFAGEIAAQQQFFYRDAFDKSHGFTERPTCIAEDNDGFLWLGTRKGLFRFDGAIAREIKFAPIDSLLEDSKKIGSLALDRQRNILWLATSSGVFKYHILTGQSERLAAETFFDPSTYKTPGCTEVFVDRQGEIWAKFAVPGITNISPDGKTAQTYTCDITQKVTDKNLSWSNLNYVLCFSQDVQHDSIIWAGSKAGLIRFNKITRKTRHYYFTHKDKYLMAGASAIHSILTHTDGKVYLGTFNGGLLIFDPVSEQFENQLIHPGALLEKERKNNIDFLFPYTANQIWCSKTDEILLLNTQTKQFDQVFESGQLFFIDRAKNYWMLTTQGLALFHHSKNQILRLPFPNQPQFKIKQISYAWEDTSTQTIFLRTLGISGLPAYDRRKQEWRLLPFEANTGEPINGSILQKTGLGILANDLGRFYLLAPGAKRFKRIPLSIPETAGWLAAHKSPQGDIFITANKGYMFWLKPGAKDVITYFKTDIGAPVQEHFFAPTIRMIDHYGRPWITCYGGFSVFDPVKNTFTHVPIALNRPRHFSQYLNFKPDSQGRIWAMGQDEIGWINPDFPEQGVQQQFGRNQNIGLSELSGIQLIDPKNRIWLESHDNLSRFDPVSGELITFEGITNEELHLLDGGEIAFMHPRGLGLMHPDSLKPNTEQARLYVSWLKVFDQEKVILGNMFAPEALYLKPDENFFSIGFSALGFFNNEKLQFAYKLKGLHQDWQYPEQGIRFATFTGIEGGDYVFQLKVANGQGVWNPQIFEWPIKVGTPWWATWWFRLALLGAIASWIYFMVKTRFRQQQILLENQKLLLEREQMLRQERDRIASEMHDDLGAGLSTIRMLSLAAKSHESDPKQTSRIDKIAQSAADVMEKMADIIWVMNSRNDSLENFAAYLRRYAGEYLDTHGIVLAFDMPDTYTPVLLSGEQRRNLLLAVKECLHNIVKHAGATEAKLHFSLYKSLKITVHDNGEGIPEALLSRIASSDQNLPGNGLLNLQQRMAKLGGTVTISRQKGTKITLETGILMAP